MSLERKYDENVIKSDYHRFLFIYDIWAKLTETKAQRKVMEFASIENGDNVLEVAVGTGMLFKKIVELNPQGSNEGVDLSPDMLSKAASRMRKVEGKYHLQVGNAMDLPFEDNSFDKLVNMFMLDLLPEDSFQKILSEFTRVVKPGGVIVVATMSKGAKRRNSFWSYLSKKTPRLLAGCRPVSLESNLNKLQVTLETEDISQNTFPARVYKITT